MVEINNQIVNTKGCQYHIEGSEKLYSADFVMQAIKEKEEREKGCIYCNEKENKQYQISVGKNYCFNCGRKLGDT